MLDQSDKDEFFMNEESITINGVEYILVDTPFKESPCNCLDCDILKLRPPQNMMQRPMCCDKEYVKINKSCCKQLKKGINRIWKIKSV